jgi:hypothetical protein
MKFARFACVLAILMMAGSALSQQGHPLSGAWLGDWGPSATHRNDIRLVMSWDGKAVTGQIGVGPDAIQLRNVSLDSANQRWMVHFEFDAKDQKGTTVRYIADGKLENIGSYHRTITGTWNHGSVKGTFKITRD